MAALGFAGPKFAGIGGRTDAWMGRLVGKGYGVCRPAVRQTSVTSTTHDKMSTLDDTSLSQSHGHLGVLSITRDRQAQLPIIFVVE